MPCHVCPWWMGYFIDNPLRRLIHNPDKILGDYVKTGMTVMDVGCGMGLFSIAMAKMVGDKGRVFSVDLQQKMLDVMKKEQRMPVSPIELRPIVVKQIVLGSTPKPILSWPSLWYMK